MESEVKNGMITQPLLSSWRESLTIVGHAVCVHPQCRLCFLSIQGMISHHKTCTGWTGQGDYIPCTHCGARFKQFRSIQTHLDRCHNNQFSASTSQSSGSWASPPPLPLTPDIVPRPAAPAPTSPTSPPTPSGSQAMTRDLDTEAQEVGGAWGRRLSCTTNQSSLSVREDVLAEKEVRLSELESLVRQTEIKAEQARKEAELSQWERDLEAREREYRRRLEEATKILNETRGGARPSSSFLETPPSFMSSESVRSSSTSGVSPPVEGEEEPGPSQRQTIHVLSPRQIFGPPRPPIVLPASAKLPASAIRLTPTTLPLFQNTATSSSSISQTSSEDSPINLSKPRHERSIDEETSISQPASISSDIIAVESLPGDLPCVEVSQATSFELPLKVVDDRVTITPSIEAGDSVKVSYPVTDSHCQILLQDDVILQDYLHTPGAQVVTFVAEDGPNGQITLVPQEDFKEAATDQISEEFDQLKRNMAEINIGDGQIAADEETPSTRAENSQVINYFEERLKDFECEINQNDLGSVLESEKIPVSKYNNEQDKNTQNISLSSNSCSAIKKRKSQIFENDDSESLSVSISKRRRSSRINSSDTLEENDDIVTTSNTPVIEGKLPKKDEPLTFSCGRCKSVLQSERSWKRHRDSVHGGCSRLQAHPDGQLFSAEEEDQAWRAALATYKKISCPRCNKVSFTKQTVLKDHLTECHTSGPPTETTECQTLNTSNPPAEITKCKTPKTSRPPAGTSRTSKTQKTPAETSKNPKTSRTPAETSKTPKTARTSKDAYKTPTSRIKAESNKKPKTPMTTAETNKTETETPSRSRRKAATKARSNVAEFVKAMKTKYDGDSSEEEPEIEPNPEDSDENFNIGTEVNVVNFYKQVKVGGRISYQCTVCKAQFKKKEEVENHILSEHKDRLSEGEDDDIEDSEEESSGPDTVEDDDDDILEIKGGKTKKRKNEYSGSNQRRLIIEPNLEAIKMERKYRSLNYGQVRLTDFGLEDSQKNDWKKVKSTRLTTPSEFSPSFLVRSMFESSDKIKSRKIKTFSGAFSKSTNEWTLYTGGPVISMAWCCQETEDSQLLALVSRLEFSPSPLLENYSGAGLLQFWSVPACGEPVFELGLSHQYGDLTSLEWCPSRPEGVRGLLAGSSTDGTVRVWSVPLQGPGRGQVFTCQPHLTLHWGEEEVGQCLSASWYRGPGHHYLAASTSQGLVSVWHLASTSPLLRQDSRLLPAQTWLAHTGTATSVSLSPGTEQAPRYVVTGGSDRCYKFWDLRDTSVPIQEVKRGLVSGVDWVPGWCGAAVSYDDVYLQGHTQTMLAEAGYTTTKSHPVISQNSAVTSLGVSQWLGCMAVTTTAGELILFVMPSLERSLEHDKNLAQRRVYVYRTEVTSTSSPADSEARKFEAVKDVHSVTYIDSSLSKTERQVCPAEELRRVRLATDTEDLTQFPLAGLTALAWNNNLGHQNILASGGQAGIVRIHRLEALNTPPVQALLREIT